MDFLALPLEIRCLIYHCYGIRRCLRPYREADKQANQSAADEITKCLDIVEPALLLSCRQVYDEAFPIMGKRYTALLPSGPFAARILSKAEEKGFFGFQSLHLLVTPPELEAANSAITDASWSTKDRQRALSQAWLGKIPLAVRFARRTCKGGELILHIGQARRVCSDEAYMGEGTLQLLKENLAELYGPATVVLHDSCS